MAKRKNPLKDIDAFLKQESTSFVDPEKISPKKEKKAASTKDKASLASESTSTEKGEQVSKEDIIAELHTLASKEGGAFRGSFYSIIRETLESLEHSTAEDKMLINTLLYINDKNNWKKNIKSYWQNK
ncbi:hypothetical protein GCM10009122_08710 [Fulvivirga kasyanovii]|uniref:Uncharacterized protein n=1 Tax=Fulvivirga kasyanovii TaxID=396812 RepID=A0ABW9RID2_9BACT|nr:hypothetical protein [Fulvivirga kasyanovii]MTI23828.1 hypothetical protein [Fulvivirga kasyanovii]